MEIKKFKTNLKLFPLGVAIFITLSLFGVWQINFIKTNPKISLSPTTFSSPLFNDFHLIIPKLEIEAPIIANVDGSNQTAYDKALENGVAHFKGTSKPGEGSNIFIFGHSSFYWYKPGDYKEIFKNLSDLAEGDEIILWYNQKEYKYKITKIKTVSPSEVNVLQPTAEEQVSLMTCVPPGTTLKRLIIIAKPF